MLFKILVFSAILFNASTTGQFNNDAYDLRLLNNNRIPGPVVLSNKNPGLFVKDIIHDTEIAKDNDYDKWEQEFKAELGYKIDQECPSTGSCDIDEDVWLGHYPTLNELVDAYFLPEDREWALRVAFCESSAKPRDKFNEVVHHESGATGWFQHMPEFWIERSYKSGFVGFAMNHPKANVGVASWLFYEGGGSRHWNSSKSCWQTLSD
jgi:hypothetical protein